LLSSSGSLVFKASIKIIYTEDMTFRGKFYNSAVAKKKICTNIGRMYGDEEFADFVFAVKGKPFKVHKNILAEASEVFRKMFTTNMKEARNNECEIDNIEPEIFESLLRFIYTAEIPENLKEVAIELFKAAHYYEIDELRNVCEQEIHENLKKENALEIYELTCVYGGEQLKLDAWKIIKRLE
jgi:hypothetical protein